MSKKKIKKIVGFSVLGTTLGVGSHVISKADISGKVPKAKAAMGRLSMALPMAGTLTGAGWALEELNTFAKGVRKKKKRR